MKITGVSARPALEQKEVVRTSGKNKKNNDACCYKSWNPFAKGCTTKSVPQQGVQLPPPAAVSSSIAAPVQQQGQVQECCVQEQVAAPAVSSSDLCGQQAHVQQGTIAQPAKKGIFHRFHK
jgi:hypothetical protein